MSTPYIITGFRSAIGKAPRGMFRFTRPDDLAAKVIQHLMQAVPQLDKNQIDDVIVGNATPEAEQGLNIGRMISLIGLGTDKVPGMTVNRYCASGLETIAIAAAKIQSGQADCIIAGGVETMSPIPFGGWRIVPNYEVSKQNADYYWGMGLTAEAVAKEYKVSREDQDEFAFHSHRKAIAAISEGRFKDDIVPIEVEEIFLDENEKRKIKTYLVERYGDFVLYRPDVKPLTWPLWFGPFVILILAVWGLWRYLRHRKALVHQRMSDADNAQAESLLKE